MHIVILTCVIGRQDVGSCIAVQWAIFLLNHDAQIVIHCSHDEMPELRLSTFFAKDIFEKLKEVRRVLGLITAMRRQCN